MNVGERSKVKKMCKDTAEREKTGMGDRRKEWRSCKLDLDREKERKKERVRERKKIHTKEKGRERERECA